jgi:sialate O-acetylesterase
MRWAGESRRAGMSSLQKRESRLQDQASSRKFSARAHLLALCLLFVGVFAVPSLQAAPVLPHIFTDHMVIQRDAPIAVWGWADPNEQIGITIATQAANTTADSRGDWKVELAPMSAGGPFALKIAGAETIVITDVMIGEVWLASGQSNMVFPLSHATGGSDEAARADYPDIRFFTVPPKIALEPQNDTRPAAWEICSPETAKEFSAVAYFFAVDLEKKLGVPVGVILSAWSGSAAEEWTAPDSLRGKPILQPILHAWDSEPAAVRSLATTPASFQIDYDDFELLPANPNSGPPLPLSNFDQGFARTRDGGIWNYDWSAGPATWFELVSSGRADHGFALRVAGTLDGSNASYLEAGFLPGDQPADLSSFQGVKFWARGNGTFQFQSLQPTITDWDNYASPVFTVTPEWQSFTILFKDLKQAGWGVESPFTPSQLIGFRLLSMSSAADAPRPPSGLFEGMITPIAPFRMRGVLWYQGEGNALRAFQYRTLLPALIEGWRNLWNEGDFPFLIAQLPNHGSSPELGDSAWAELREAQFLTAQSVPNTGLAVTIDLGEAGNVHPPRKREVGERLALWALGNVYREQVVDSGPIFDSATFAGQSIIIHFKNAGSPLEIRGGAALQGFAVAGIDRKFHWADAQIEDATVVVTSPEVQSPVSVRYDWADDPAGNLFNAAGLPASPFRTDDWPGSTPRN